MACSGFYLAETHKTWPAKGPKDRWLIFEDTFLKTQGQTIPVYRKLSKHSKRLA